MNELTDVVTRVLGHRLAGEEVEAYGVHRISTTIQADTYASIRQIGQAETRGVGVRVIRDGRMGYASTSDLDPTVLQRTVERARANAAASDPDAAQEFAQPELARSQPGLLVSGFEEPTLADKIAIVTDLARRVVSIDSRIKALDTVEYHDERRTVAVASTRGVEANQGVGFVELWADALGEDRGGRAGDNAYQFGRSIADFNVESLAAEAVGRTVRLLGPVVPRPLDVPVVLDPGVAAQLLTQVGKGLSGGPISSGRTPFAGRQGALVAAECVDLADHGTSPRFLGAASFDDEGVPRRRTHLIVRGVLVGALHSTVTARAARSTTGSTGSAHRSSHKSVPRAAPAALVLESTGSLAELTADLDEAVYIQQLSGAGAGINAVNGRIDVGGVAWLLRGGQIAGRVGTISISTDLSTLLRSVVAVGDDSYQAPFTPAAGSTVVCDGTMLLPTR